MEDTLISRAKKYYDTMTEKDREFWDFDLLVEAMALDIRNQKDKSLTRKTVTELAEKEIAIVHALREMLQTPKLETKPKKKPDDQAEAAVLLLSDLHFGKEVRDEDGTVTYNMAIASERLHKILSNSLKVIKRVSHNTPIDELILVLAGDLVDGDSIYPTQAYHIEDTPPFQMRAVLHELIALLKTVSEIFTSVKVYCVKGNHGSAGKDHSEESNHDLALYTQLEFFVDELKNTCHELTNVSVCYSRTDFINFDVKGWRMQARHTAPKHSGTYASQCKFEGWHNLHKCQIMLYGHWHHFTMFDVNKDLRVFRNSSLMNGDDLSERMSVSAIPGQWLFGVSNKYKTTWQYMIEVK